MQEQYRASAVVNLQPWPTVKYSLCLGRGYNLSPVR